MPFVYGGVEELALHRSTASFTRTVMYSSPISCGMCAFSSRRMTWREGLLRTGWTPLSLCCLIQSCSRQHFLREFQQSMSSRADARQLTAVGHRSGGEHTSL